MPGVLVDGKYEIIAEIGEGGMGFVYEAFHHFLGKRVAIKLLRAGLDSVELCQRFEHEARVAANCDRRTWRACSTSGSRTTARTTW
ncbi:MAG: hypothetical protein U0169_19045 [Polyangiaceae bacterium]